MKALARNVNKLLTIRKKRSLISYTSPNSLISEQYRTLRTNIQFASVDHTNRTFIITSPGHNEGKSTTTVNLAISMAQQGQKVLLVDADIKKPMLHHAFKINNNTGLTNVLVGHTQLENAIFQTEIGRLGVLPSGPTPPNPSELIGSKAMKELMKKLLEEYDLIFFDCPPVLEATDTKILANQCDSVLLVVKYGKTDKESALEANRVLNMCNAKLLGIILNEKK